MNGEMMMKVMNEWMEVLDLHPPLPPHTPPVLYGAPELLIGSEYKTFQK